MKLEMTFSIPGFDHITWVSHCFEAYLRETIFCRGPAPLDGMRLHRLKVQCHASEVPAHLSGFMAIASAMTSSLPGTYDRVVPHGSHQQSLTGIEVSSMLIVFISGNNGR